LRQLLSQESDQRLPDGPAVPSVCGYSRRAERLESLGSDIPGDDRIHPMIDHQLSGLNTSSSTGRGGAILQKGEGSRIALYDDEVGASSEMGVD